MSTYNHALGDAQISKKRQTYHRKKYAKLKKQLNKGEKFQPFSELQTLLNQQQQQHSLIIGKGCNCKVCAKNCQAINIKQDHYLTTNPDSYLNLFCLLQHLTMIEAEEAPRLLGIFPIPIFFFKRQVNDFFNQNKNTKVKKISLEQPSFVVFKNNLKTGLLQHPFLIKSLSKLAKLIQLNEQTNRKQKHKQKYNERSFENIHDDHHTLEFSDSNNFVHHKHFQESIPSYAFPSAKIKSMQSIHKYIIHQEDAYIKQQTEDHKLKKSQPFCIFRYNMIQKQEKVSKYELFTLQTLEIYQRKRQVGYNSIKAQQKKLSLVYVQSYTKIKTQEIKSKLDLSGKRLDKQIQTIYFSQYSLDEVKRGQLNNSAIYQLVELQIKLKLDQISRIDPNYLNNYELEQKIEKTLRGLQDQDSKQQKITNLKLRRLSNYKTYKIVAILEQVCQLRVEKIKIKWMLNDYDQLVLLECLQYQIDHNDQNLRKKNKKNSHSQHILKNGLDYLKEYYNIEDIANIFHSHDDIQQLIRIRRQSKQTKNTIESKNIKLTEEQVKNQNTFSYTASIKKKKSPRYFSQETQKLSRSIPFYESISHKKITLQTLQNSIPVEKSRMKINPKSLQQYISGYYPLQIVRDCKFYLNEQKFQRAEIFETQKQKINHEKNRLEQKINLLKLIRDRFSFTKKSYRLKPFKTEESK